MRSKSTVAPLDQVQDIRVEVPGRERRHGAAAHREAHAVDALAVDAEDAADVLEHALRVDLAHERAEVPLVAAERGDEEPAAPAALGREVRREERIAVADVSAVEREQRGHVPGLRAPRNLQHEGFWVAPARVAQRHVVDARVAGHGDHRDAHARRRDEHPGQSGVRDATLGNAALARLEEGLGALHRSQARRCRRSPDQCTRWSSRAGRARADEGQSQPQAEEQCSHE